MTEADLITAIGSLVESNNALAEGLRLQAMAIQAMTDAIAEPVDDEESEPEPERFMDGTLVDP